VFIVSASPEEIVQSLGDFLGVDEAIASRARVDEAGRYTGEMERYAYGPFKAEVMREIAAAEGIDLAASYAYSDSYTDAPMLEVVGHPVAVNPDRVLLKLAREREWEVRTFAHPVRLRDRMPVPDRKQALAGAGALAMGAGLAVGWRLVRRQRVPPPSAVQRAIRPVASLPRRFRGR
jgi:hypothetical protein